MEAKTQVILVFSSFIQTIPSFVCSKLHMATPFCLMFVTDETIMENGAVGQGMMGWGTCCRFILYPIEGLLMSDEFL